MKKKLFLFVPLVTLLFSCGIPTTSNNTTTVTTNAKILAQLLVHTNKFDVTVDQMIGSVDYPADNDITKLDKAKLVTSLEGYTNNVKTETVDSTTTWQKSPLVIEYSYSSEYLTQQHETYCKYTKVDSKYYKEDPRGADLVEVDQAEIDYNKSETGLSIATAYKGYSQANYEFFSAYANGNTVIELNSEQIKELLITALSASYNNYTYAKFELSNPVINFTNDSNFDFSFDIKQTLKATKEGTDPEDIVINMEDAKYEVKDGMFYNYSAKSSSAETNQSAIVNFRLTF